MSGNIDVIGFGALNLDVLYSVPWIAVPDHESEITGEDVTCGGSAANTVIGLSRLGVSTSYIAKIGDDNSGELLLNNLKQENVDISNIMLDSTGSSGQVLGFVDSQGERALYVGSGVNDNIVVDELDLDLINRTKILHYSSFVGDSFNAQVDLLDFLDDDIVLSFDPGVLYVKKGIGALRKILERTNILLINEDELKILYSDDENYKQLARHIHETIETVVVKRGKKGVYVINKSQEIETPAFQTKPQDTTGAGDSFNAGFLYSYLQKYNLKKSCEIGNWIASQTIQATGASTSAPTIKQLQQAINKKIIKG